MKKLTGMGSLGLLLALSMIATFAGCDSTSSIEEYDKSDIGKVSSLVYDMADGTRNMDRFKHLFAGDGAALTDKERVEYAKHKYNIDGEPTFSGDTATIKVKVNEYSGKELGQVEWTAVKENNQWKLKSAPVKP